MYCIFCWRDKKVVEFKTTACYWTRLHLQPFPSPPIKCQSGRGRAASAVAGSDFPQPSQGSQPVLPFFFFCHASSPPSADQYAHCRPLPPQPPPAKKSEREDTLYSVIYSCHDDFEEPSSLPFPITSLPSPGVVIPELSAGPEWCSDQPEGILSHRWEVEEREVGSGAL